MAPAADVRLDEQTSDGGDDEASDGVAAAPACCPLYHRAVELIGRRWTGAILETLVQAGSLRFSQIASAVAALSDRMLSDRLKELEAHGLVERTVFPGPPVRVEYALTRKGRELAPALAELKRWARAWLGDGAFENGGGVPSRFAAAAPPEQIAELQSPMRSPTSPR
jgi:DNA-binding HxlR family transcriptional regulator